MFAILSDECTAAEIYYGYLHLKIVAVKRWKGKSNWNAEKAPTGMRTNAGLSSMGVTGISLERNWKQQLVKDYCQHVRRACGFVARVDQGQSLTAMVIPDASTPEWKVVFDEALRHVHAMIIQDISPPWRFSRKPTMSQLHVYVRATFLYWSAEDSPLVFGEDIVDLFLRTTHGYDLAFAGIVGRPLYVCGALKPARAERESVPVSDSTLAPCLNIAAMSPLLKFKGEKHGWRCTQCAKAGLPADRSQRLLRLYPLVHVGPTEYTPLRSKPITIAVALPPAEFDWEQHAGNRTSMRAAQPSLQMSTVYATFTSDESRSIWLMSTRYGANG